MASTRIRISRAQRRRFERLKSNLAAARGQSVSSGELLDFLLELGEAAWGPDPTASWRALSPTELERVMALPLDFGFELGDVDEGLYGKQPRPDR